MEIFVTTKNLQKYGFNDISFCFPHDKIQDSKDDIFRDINTIYDFVKHYPSMQQVEVEKNHEKEKL